MRITCGDKHWDVPNYEKDRLIEMLVNGELERATNKFSALEIRPRKKAKAESDPTWDDIIAYAQSKQRKSAAKAYQLSVLIEEFKLKKRRKEETPFELVRRLNAERGI